MLFYHSTPLSNLPGIFANGLTSGSYCTRSFGSCFAMAEDIKTHPDWIKSDREEDFALLEIYVKDEILDVCIKDLDAGSSIDFFICPFTIPVRQACVTILDL